MPTREAFLGDDRFQWSDNRCRAFVEAVAAKGHGVAAFSHRCRKPAPADDDLAVEAWLMGLPKPVALLACYDIRGRQAIDACRRAGFKHTEYMTVAFTKRHGMPPSRWRQERRSRQSVVIRLQSVFPVGTRLHLVHAATRIQQVKNSLPRGTGFSKLKTRCHEGRLIPTARRATRRGSGGSRWGESGRPACRVGRSPSCSGSPARSCRPYRPAAYPRSSRGSPD